MPIFDGQASNARELGDVVSDQNQSTSEGNRCNLEVVRTNDVSRRFQRRAHFAISLRGPIIKGQADECFRQLRDEFQIGRRIIASIGAVEQLCQNNGAKADFARPFVPNLGEETRILASLVLDASVGIEKIAVHRVARCSKSPCGRR